MKKVRRKLKKSNGILRFLYYVISLVYAVSLVFFIKNLLDLKGIENALRTSLIIFFVLYLVMDNLQNVQKQN